MGTSDVRDDRLDDIAVVICTRHRPPMTRAAVASVLQASPAPALLIIVDQSDPDSPDPLREFDGLPGVTRIHHRATGLCRARNVGAAAAEAAGASIVAYTDDDCTADPGWLAGLMSAFAMAEDVSLAFGTTKAAPHDPHYGMIPAYTVQTATVHRGLSSKSQVEGMGACMAVRIADWRRIGGFDDRLGAGTPLAAAEENDLALRLLHAGCAIAQTPAAVVFHHGYRDRRAAEALVAGYMRGSGAVIAKMVRLGGMKAIAPLAAIGMRWLQGWPAVHLGPLPPRRPRLWSVLEGARAGLTLPMDSRTARFLPFAGPDDLERPNATLRADADGPGGISDPVVAPCPRKPSRPAPPRRSLLEMISGHQMVWLFNRRLTAWMADRSLSRQFPFFHRMFFSYCVAWSSMMPSSWIVGGKQLFFLLSALNSLSGGPRECFLEVAGAKVGLDLGDPRSIKVVYEFLPGAGETASLGSLLGEGDSFVDIGANHGGYSLAAARIVGPSGAIIAVEAQPRLASLLEQSLEASVRCRHEVHAIALGDRRGTVPFYVLRRNSGESGMFRGPSSAGVHSVTSVPMERFDDAIAWHDLPGKVVMKIDVEGAEDRVLAGGGSFLAARRPVIVMEVNPKCMAAAGVTWTELSARLRGLGYDRCAEATSPHDRVPLDAIDPGVQRDIVIFPAASSTPKAKPVEEAGEP